VKYAPSEEQTTLRLSPRFLPHITHGGFAAMIWLIELELCSRFAEDKTARSAVFIATSEIVLLRAPWASKAARRLALRKLPQLPKHTEPLAPEPLPTEGSQQNQH
jgi:hypothetical protein